MKKIPKPKNESPYESVKEIGITQKSSMKEVKNASLEIMGKGFTPEIRTALDELRLVNRRLYVDFFLHNIEEEMHQDFQEIEIEQSDLELLDFPEEVTEYLKNIIQFDS